MQTAMIQRCTDCGYVYEPEKNGGIPLVERTYWECPGIDGTCGATVDKYEIIEPFSPLADSESDATGDDEPEESITVHTDDEVLKANRAERAVADLVRMYDEKELILQPDRQRYYVWTNKQAS
jgi:hypothetical protein